MERARQIMQTIPCSNGLCDQQNCNLRHTRPPTRIARRGILDRAISDEDEKKREEEELNRALVESLYASLCCSYCSRKFDNNESLQLHQAGNCAEMEGDGRKSTCDDEVASNLVNPSAKQQQQRNSKGDGHGGQDLPNNGDPWNEELERSWIEQEELEEIDRNNREGSPKARRSYGVPRGAFLPKSKKKVTVEREQRPRRKTRMTEKMAEWQSQLGLQKEQNNDMINEKKEEKGTSDAKNMEEKEKNIG